VILCHVYFYLRAMSFVNVSKSLRALDNCIIRDFDRNQFRIGPLKIYSKTISVMSMTLLCSMSIRRLMTSIKSF
jgi:hypothetical protein